MIDYDPTLQTSNSRSIQELSVWLWSNCADMIFHWPMKTQSTAAGLGIRHIKQTVPAQESKETNCGGQKGQKEQRKAGKMSWQTGNRSMKEFKTFILLIKRHESPNLDISTWSAQIGMKNLYHWIDPWVSGTKTLFSHHSFLKNKLIVNPTC